MEYKMENTENYWKHYFHDWEQKIYKRIIIFKD